jgi:hypothetical protein
VTGYKKFFSMLLATVLAAIAPALTDNTFSVTEIFNVLAVALGAVGVLGAGNLPAGVWAYMKGYVAAASAIVVFASSALTDGWTNAETIQAILAGLGAVGVIALPGPVVAPVSVGRHAVKDF